MVVRPIKFGKKLSGKRVLLRLTLNVPIEAGVIQNDFRLKKVLPTLEKLASSGARTVIISHLGASGEESLKPVVRWLNKFLPVGFVPRDDWDRTKAVVESLSEGGIVVLENLRRFSEEKENDKNFARKLSELGKLFVNEDFAASHRPHASIVGIPRFLPSFFGPLFVEEVKNLSRAFKPPRPFVVVLGGAKFETKIPLVEKFLKTANQIFISGALANTVFNELGFEMGQSLVDDKKLGVKKFASNKKVILPKDVIAVSDSKSRVCRPNEVKKNEKILDIGPESVKEIIESIQTARFVLWNGPFGKFEDGFSKSTEDFAKALAGSEAESVIGGGDTIAAIAGLNLLDKFSFVSTAGGAMLEFLARGTLPGIEAIQRRTEV